MIIKIHQIPPPIRGFVSFSTRNQRQAIKKHVLEFFPGTFQLIVPRNIPIPIIPSVRCRFACDIRFNHLKNAAFFNFIFFKRDPIPDQ